MPAAGAAFAIQVSVLI